MADIKLNWFDDFLGVGYHFYDVRPRILLIFDGKKKIFNTWNKLIKYWPDDEISVRFIEINDTFEFLLYCESRILQATWVFIKALKISEHYKKFKEDYDGAAILGLALYKPKDDSYELEIFKYKKRITDVKFLKDSETEQDFIILRAKQILRGSNKTI